MGDALNKAMSIFSQSAADAVFSETKFSDSEAIWII